MRRRRPQRPPKRRCRDCGTDVYAWTESPLCPSCVRDVLAPSEREPIRDFLRRTGRLSPEPEGSDT